MLPLDRARPFVGASIGVLLSLGIGAAFLPFHDAVTRAVPAMLLVVPVVLASAIGGRVAGLVTGAAAALALSFTLPPVGSPRIRLSEDVVAIVVFGGVAIVTNALVTTRIQSLEAVGEQRRALLRSVSHDLRTPLATIRAVATDLRDGPHYDRQTREELLDVLIDEAGRLDRLVANLLSMSRIEAGALRPEFTSVDMAELIASSVSRVQRRSTHRPISCVIDDDLPGVRGDYTQLGQVLDNLLDNAAQHTPRGTAIEVRASRHADGVRLEVIDRGPGIPHAQRHPSGRTAGVGGFGLPICRAIVAQHAGTLRIDDTAGGGAHVTVDLPGFG